MDRTQELRFRHRAAHPNFDPSGVPSLPLSLHTYASKVHIYASKKWKLTIDWNRHNYLSAKPGAMASAKQGAERRRERNANVGGQICAEVSPCMGTCLHAQEPTEYSPPADGGEQSSDTVRINATQNTPRLPLAEHSCQPSLI